ncbi:MAG: hypothetical protein MUO76_17455, partial [Anaerolineaceae bacterium]|nr:hypothetical protein [Anaerolineaceae bacterium]
MKTRTTELEANWKKRFRISEVLFTVIASERPERGLAVSNKSGVMQLYAWDVLSGEMRQFTDYPTGKMFGNISPDGSYIYYLKDEGGNEIGHLVRVPFEGGDEEDISPKLPPYATFINSTSRTGNRLVFTAAGHEGFKLYAIDLGPKGELTPARLLYHSKLILQTLPISYGGELAATNSIELSGVLQTNLLVVDCEKGEKVAELWDGEGTSLSTVSFSPVKNDLCLLATTNKSGYSRPLIWNPITGERIDIALDELVGDVTPSDWAPDGKSILLSHFHEATRQFYIYDLDEEKLHKLDHPSGSFTSFSGLGTYFVPGGEIYTHWQDSTHPSQLIALDSKTGKQTRVVIPSEEVPVSQPWRSVTFPSSDGTRIQAWLATPHGVGPFPTILHTHGGPTSVLTESFDASAQAWL